MSSPRGGCLRLPSTLVLSCSLQHLETLAKPRHCCCATLHCVLSSPSLPPAGLPLLPAPAHAHGRGRTYSAAAICTEPGAVAAAAPELSMVCDMRYVRRHISIASVLLL